MDAMASIASGKLVSALARRKNGCSRTGGGIGSIRRQNSNSNGNRNSNDRSNCSFDDTDRPFAETNAPSPLRL